MDESTGHFLVMVGDVCLNARLASLPVEITLRDGTVVAGIPNPREAEQTDGVEVDDTGFARELAIGDQIVPLDAVVEMRIVSPAA
jgi:hypothetical protein